ncbi:MAG: carbohydrate ABC transporter substrate-binding protein [Clostridia bacterium]|nr:carbohydrate ABC transporter substrate-binding protein [Clostridia bacterium]
MKHRISASIAAALLISALASCGDAASPETKDTGTAPAVTEAVTAAPTIYDDLPKEDYGGYEFRVLNNTSNFAYTNFGLEGQTGEALDDVIFERNAKVEEALNIKLVITDMGWEDNQKAINTAVPAGEDAYDIYFNELHFVLGQALNGYLLDYTDIDSFNFDNVWWNKNAIESASIGESIYAAFGDLHLMYYECFFPIVFNKQILNNLDLDDPYQLVNDGKWTLDAMMTMMMAAKQDVDGDGKWTVADQYPIGVWEHNVNGLLVSAGADVLTKNKDNIPVWEGLDEHFINVYDKLVASAFADKTNNVANAAGFKSENGSEVLHVMMQEGKVLFYIEPLGSVKKMRDVDYEIGVVPMPKYDEAQKEYRSYIYHGAGSMGIPKTNSDPERTGVICEYLAAYSHETVRETYFNETLDFKYIQDEEGQKMLDIIFANGTVDLTAVYGWGTAMTTIRGQLFKGKTDIVSVVEKRAAKIESGIADTVEALANVEG